MKKHLYMLLCALLLCATFPGLAEEAAPALTRTVSIATGLPDMTFVVRKVGEQVRPNESFPENVYRVDIAVAGQERPLQSLYYSTELEAADHYFTLADINFDGYLDLDFVTTAGVVNQLHCFFLWNPVSGQYEATAFGGSDLCLYALFPEKGLILSFVRDGALFGLETLYRWQDGRLQPVRSAELRSFMEETNESIGDEYVLTTRFNSSLAEEIVIDYADGEQKVTHYEVYELAGTVSNDALWLARYDHRTELLWQGL